GMRLFDETAGDEPAGRNERVASPVEKPRVARDDARPFAATDEKRARCRSERFDEVVARPGFRFGSGGTPRRLELRTRDDRCRFPAGERKLEPAGAVRVASVGQAARRFLRVDDARLPFGRRVVGAALDRCPEPPIVGRTKLEALGVVQYVSVSREMSV